MQLVDTNVLSELMRQQPDAGVLGWLQGRQQLSPRLTVSVITIDEIAFGLTRRPNARLQEWFDSFLQRHIILPVTTNIARRAGELRAQLQVKGQVRTQADMLSAATAQLHGLAVVTRNLRDFEGCGIAVLNPFSV